MNIRIRWHGQCRPDEQEVSGHAAVSSSSLFHVSLGNGACLCAQWWTGRKGRNEVGD